MFCIKTTWIRKVKKVDMYGWIKQIYTPKIPILTAFAI